MRNTTFTTCVTIWLLTFGPASPQTPPSDAMAAARELLIAMRFADQFRATFPMVMQSLKPAIVQNRPELERDFDATVPLLLDAMNPRLNDATEQMASIYALNFTADELRDLTGFFRTPTGEKYLQKFPAIVQQSIALGQRFGQSVAPEMQNRMIEELRKRGHKI